MTVSRFGGVTLFPNLTMLYTVYLQYSVVVDAETNGGAYRQLCKKMRSDPGLFITRVTPGGGERKKKSLLRQFLLG